MSCRPGIDLGTSSVKVVVLFRLLENIRDYPGCFFFGFRRPESNSNPTITTNTPASIPNISRIAIRFDSIIFPAALFRLLEFIQLNPVDYC
jgi:hypothetical protein